MHNIKKDVGLALNPVRPSSVLAAAERTARNWAKLLRSNKEQIEGLAGSASVDDVVALSETIVALAVFGRKQSAASAIEVVSKVEILLDHLANQVDDLLASTK